MATPYYRIVDSATLLCLPRVAADRALRSYFCILHVTANLHSPARQLIALRIEHADLDALIDRLAAESLLDQLTLQRLKKRRLALRDHIARLQATLDPREPA